MAATAPQKAQVLELLYRDLHQTHVVVQHDVQDALNALRNRFVAPTNATAIVAAAITQYKVDYAALAAAFTALPPDPANWEPTAEQLARIAKGGSIL